MLIHFTLQQFAVFYLLLYQGLLDGVHRVDGFFDPFDESLLEHLSEGDVVMATKPRILLEVLDVLFSGVGGHGDILEFSSSGSGGV